MPETTRTSDAALKSGTEIVQMSMQFWALELAKGLRKRLGYKAEILSIPEDQLSDYLEQKLKPVPILNFLNTINITRGRAIREEAQPYLLDAVDEEDLDDEE